jgi:acetyltransferase-like isoleucine patch superfamily enzyme
MISIDKTSIVETKEIGDGTIIEEFCVIRKNVILGRGVHIYPHVVVSEGCVIGNDSRLYPGTFLGKVPDGAGALARTPLYSKHIMIGSDCAIGPNAVIYYDVKIGNNTLIGDGASIREQCVIGSKTIISRYATISYNTIIGDYTKIMDGTYITGNAKVGNNVFIGMLSSTSNDNDFVARKYSERDLGPTIEDNVSIGIGATILPGLKLCNGSLVGAGSVVTKNVPERAVVMGVPARIIKYLEKTSGDS